MSEARMNKVLIAAMWFVVFGTATHDWTLRICIGLLFAGAWGLFDSEEGEEEHE